MNLFFGSVLATISLTVPVVTLIAFMTGNELQFALGAPEMVVMVASLVLCHISFSLTFHYHYYISYYNVCFHFCKQNVRTILHIYFLSGSPLSRSRFCSRHVLGGTCILFLNALLNCSAPS